jgi:hypothetical protein
MFSQISVLDKSGPGIFGPGIFILDISTPGISVQGISGTRISVPGIFVPGISGPGISRSIISGPNRSGAVSTEGLAIAFLDNDDDKLSKIYNRQWVTKSTLYVYI